MNLPHSDRCGLESSGNDSENKYSVSSRPLGAETLLDPVDVNRKNERDYKANRFEHS